MQTNSSQETTTTRLLYAEAHKDRNEEKSQDQEIISWSDESKFGVLGLGNMCEEELEGEREQVLAAFNETCCPGL